MQERIAFTAKYWGDKAVVCRSSEDCPGPAVDQEFGEFETWTQANAFAGRLNEGLEIPPAEAEQIITSSILRTSGLLRDASSPGGEVGARPSGRASAALAIHAGGTGAGGDVLPDCALQAKRKHGSLVAECAKRVVRCYALRVSFGAGRLRTGSDYGKIGAAACGFRRMLS
ncbi:MAG TPA: hypothetical protein VIX11_15875 [Candidatus Acidoferrum sp.]